MSNADDPQLKDRWHISKGIPLALLLTLITLAAGSWAALREEAATTLERLSQIERRMQAFSDRSEMLTITVTQQGETIAVLLSQISDTNNNLNRLYNEVSTTNEILRNISQSGMGIGSR